LSSGEIHSEASDRRARARLPLRSLAYVEFEGGNGGIILNASEGGLAIQAMMSLQDGSPHRIRFQVPPSNSYFVADARVSWTARSSKMAGLEFRSLSSPALTQLRGWLVDEGTPPSALPKVRPPQRQEPRTAPPSTRRLAPIPAQSPADSPPARLRSTAASPPPIVPVESSPLRGGHWSSVPEPEPGPVAGASESSSRITDDLRDRNTLALLALLASLSVVLGWQVGHRPLVSKDWMLLGFRTHSVAADRTVPPIAKIETIGANNRTSAILNSRPANPTGSRLSETRIDVPLHGQRSVRAFRTWAPSAPVRSSSQNDARETEANPPALNDAAVAPNQILKPAMAIAGPPLVRPQPQPVTSPQQAQPMFRDGELIHRVDPVYPALAKVERIGGTVELRAYVGPDGLVRKIVVLSGPEMLMGAAEDAVRQWRYAPTELYGRPVDTTKEINLVFQPDSVPH
jgi:TonB family protein